MLRFLTALFKKRPAPKSLGPRVIDFSSLDASGFEAGKDHRYTVGVADGRLSLQLTKGGMLAWTELADSNCADFSLKAVLQLSGQKDASSGVVFRMVDDSSFACILVSSGGWIRLDVVFNGHPRPALPMLPCPWIRDKELVQLTLVARGDRYTALVDGIWAFEIADDSLPEGRLGFAARSDGEASCAGLSDCTLETRPLEVETEYLRCLHLSMDSTEQRRALANAHYAAGDYLPCIINLRRLRNPTAADLFLKAEACMRLQLLDDADDALTACLAIDPSMGDAL
ncbi:MAG TPA: hypothetical protein PLC54_07725, partial [Spirochaetales bacterium]|nr:hypothetical protein [Spirochaetales bacterium]